MLILEWKQKCNVSGNCPEYEVVGQFLDLPGNKYIPIYVSPAVASQLQAEGMAIIRHAVDSAIDYAEDFDEARDYVPGPYLSK